jgi:hypothetical protein
LLTSARLNAENIRFVTVQVEVIMPIEGISASGQNGMDAYVISTTFLEAVAVG